MNWNTTTYPRPVNWTVVGGPDKKAEPFFCPRPNVPFGTGGLDFFCFFFLSRKKRKQTLQMREILWQMECKRANKYENNLKRNEVTTTDKRSVTFCWPKTDRVDENWVKGWMNHRFNINSLHSCSNEKKRKKDQSPKSRFRKQAAYGIKKHYLRTARLCFSTTMLVNCRPAGNSLDV